MTNAFEAARDTIFGNEDRAVDAQFLETEDAEPPEGTVRVILGFTQPEAGIFQTDAQTPGNRLWVRTTDLPVRPPEGSVFIVNARRYRTRAGEISALESWWLVDVDEIAPGS